MKRITYNNITKLLPEPRSNGHEAWEFRFLFSEGASRQLIYVEVDEDMNMLRFTFPMVSANGRGRVWLKRSDLIRLDKQDISDFVRMICKLQKLSGLEVLVSPAASSLICREVGAAELFENPYVMVDKRRIHRGITK